MLRLRDTVYLFAETQWNRMAAKAVAAALVLSLLGWLFPDAIWDGMTVSVTDGDGREISSELDGADLEQIITEADQISYRSGILEFFRGSKNVIK